MIMHIDATIQRIRAFARAQGWSVYKLAAEAKLGSTQTLMRMYDPDWSPRADTLRKLEAIIPPEFDPETIPLDGTP